jgi:hypothetical protein
MKTSIHSSLLAGVAAVFLAIPTCSYAQGQQRANRGNFDPQQARQQMMERYRQRLDIKDDSEWSAIEPRIQKVLDARREASQMGMGGMMFARGRANTDNAQGDQSQPNRRNRRNNDNAQSDQGQTARRGPQPSPAAQDLQKAIAAKAPSDEIKSKLAAYRDERKQKRAQLETAQEELRKVLSLNQEATAVLMGLLQ